MNPQLRLYRAPAGILWRYVFTAMCAGAIAGPGVAPAWGQWAQTHKLIADDAAGRDWFGLSVAISGDLAIVGAPLHDPAGSAYVFDVTTGEQLYKLTDADAAESKAFGRSVSISDDIAIVGAPFDDDACPNDPYCPSGAAYLFDLSTSELLHKLTAIDGAKGDFFGESVAINGGIALVGAAMSIFTHSVPSADAAYLFDVTTGTQLHKLIPEDAAPDNLFGFSVALSGGVAIVGAYGDPHAGFLTGSAYLFDVATGTQLHKLTADDADREDYFGLSVAIDGGIAIVGAPGDDDAGVFTGSAYLFDVATGTQLQKLAADDSDLDDVFGLSVAIDGGIAIVGARGTDDACPGDPNCGSGSAYLFDVATGQQLQKLTAADAAAEDGFGISVSISGDRAIVGAWQNELFSCPAADPDCNPGFAYLFALSDPCDDEDGDGRVTVCHFPRGRRENARTMTVGIRAVRAHLAHGDHCGPCEEDQQSLRRGDRATDQENQPRIPRAAGSSPRGP